MTDLFDADTDEKILDLIAESNNNPVFLGKIWEAELSPQGILDCYNSAKELGIGSFGRVKKVGDYAVKQIFHANLTLNDKPIEDAQCVKKEMSLLYAVKCPFSIRYLGGFLSQGLPYIVMEYANTGSFEKIMAEHFDQIPAKVLGQITCQMLLLLNYAQKMKILHRDLKLENIFLDSRGIVKVGDYGVGKQLPSGDKDTATQTGNYAHMSPERMLNKPYNMSVDIWSLGILVAEMSCGHCPKVNNVLGYEQYCQNEIWHNSLRLYLKQEYLQNQQIPTNKTMSFVKLNSSNSSSNSKPVVFGNVATKTSPQHTEDTKPSPQSEIIPASDELINFVLRCVQFDPQKRPKPAELLQDPFIKHACEEFWDDIVPLIECNDWESAEIPEFPELKEFAEGIQDALFFENNSES